MLKNKIRVFVLALVIIAVCKARPSLKKLNAVKEKSSKFNFHLYPLFIWPFNLPGVCDKVSPVDSHSDTKSVKDDDNDDIQWPEDCGLGRFSMRKSDSTFQSKWSSFKNFLSEIQRSLEDIKSVVKRDADDRIINGAKVGRGEWPWLAALGTIDEGLLCGASIINENWLVTAASCFSYRQTDKPCNYNVRVGTRNWLIDYDYSGQDRRLAGIYRHPDYSESESYENNIALVKLDKPIPLAPGTAINAICLPKTARSADKGTICKTAGWGQEDADEQDTLTLSTRQTSLPVVGYEGDKCGEFEGVDKTLPGEICAGVTDGSTGTCDTDDGGPLTFEANTGRVTLLGLTSHWPDCVREGYPSFFVDVGYYYPWIKSVIKSNS